MVAPPRVSIQCHLFVDFDSRRVCSTRVQFFFFFFQFYSHRMYFLSILQEKRKNVEFYSVLCRKQKCRQKCFRHMHKIDVYVESFRTPSVFFCRCRTRAANSRIALFHPLTHCVLCILSQYFICLPLAYIEFGFDSENLMTVQPIYKMLYHRAPAFLFNLFGERASIS